MRVLVAGGTGVIGRQLLPLLLEIGDDVSILTRPGAAIAIDGVRPVYADALDRDAVAVAVRTAHPDAIVNILTAIPRVLEPRHFAEEMATTNRLRAEGTANLVAAAPGARLVSEGLAYAYDPAGGPVADEDRPLWVDGPRPFRPAVRALGELERLTADAGGVVLRLGHLYGPGTAFAPDGAFTEQLVARRAPVVGRGNAMFSFLHAHDAATAIVAALDKPVQGVLNICDDDPAYIREWLPQLARIVDAPAPRHAPAAVARMAVGSWGVAYMNRIAGAANSRARLALDWKPRYTSWRTGFVAELGSQPRSKPRLKPVR
jgi:nucleoside-diphosphate-sugar epimerase